MMDLTGQEPSPADEFDPDDWFGDESPFSDSESLAAALMAMGGGGGLDVSPPPAPPEVEKPALESQPEWKSPFERITQTPGANVLPPTTAPLPPAVGMPQTPPPSTPAPITPPVQPALPPQIPAAASPPTVVPPPSPTAPTPPVQTPPPVVPGDAQKRRWVEMSSHSFVPQNFHVQQEQGPVGDVPALPPTDPAGSQQLPSSGYRTFEPGTGGRVQGSTRTVTVSQDLPPISWNTRNSVSQLKDTERIIDQLRMSATQVTWAAASLAVREVQSASVRHRATQLISSVIQRGFNEEN